MKYRGNICAIVASIRAVCSHASLSCCLGFKEAVSLCCQQPFRCTDSSRSDIGESDFIAQTAAAAAAAAALLRHQNDILFYSAAASYA